MKQLVAVVLLLMILAATASAGVPAPRGPHRTSGSGFASTGGLDVVTTGIPNPAPERCGFELHGQTVPCQFRFGPDGGLDALTVAVTLRDLFDTPLPITPTSCSLEVEGTGVFCTCCPERQEGISAVNGSVEFVFRRIGGWGRLAVHVTAHYTWSDEDFWIASGTLDFTSPDLDGSCDPAPGAVTVTDLGLWAACLHPAPYCRRSDYDCDGTVDIVDLGFWAGGLGTGCGGPCP